MVVALAIEFVAPGIPPRRGIAGKQLDTRHVTGELDDALSNHIGLAGLLSERGFDDLVHTIATVADEWDDKLRNEYGD